MSIVWLMAIALTLGTVAILAYVTRGWFGTRPPDPGWMSEQWLAEYRAGSRQV